MTPHEQAIEELCNCKELLRSLPKGEAWEQIHAQIDDIDEALSALRSEPSGSVSDQVIRAGERVIEAWGQFWNGRHNAPAQTRLINSLKALRDALDASRSTPAVPSVEEIVKVVNDWMMHHFDTDVSEDHITGPDLRARLTQAQLSGNSGGLGRSGTNVPSASSGLADARSSQATDQALQPPNAPSHGPLPVTNEILVADDEGCNWAGTGRSDLAGAQSPEQT